MKHVQRIKRGAKEHVYFRAPTGFRTKLPPMDAPEFQSAYAEACRLAESQSDRAAAMRQLLRKAVARSKARAALIGKAFALTPELVADLFDQQQGRCAVTSLQFRSDRIAGERSNPFRPSIDRKDSRFGYVPENVRLVLIAVNVGKADFGDEAYVRVCQAVARAAARR